MSENNLWYGYLDAGEKSSPVLMDQRLSTANPGTVYVFNLRRSEIIEYRRDIVEPKLRDLSDEESAVIKELKSAYTKVSGGFVARGARISSIPEKAKEPRTPPKKAAPIETDEDGVLDISGILLVPSATTWVEAIPGGTLFVSR